MLIALIIGCVISGLIGCVIGAACAVFLYRCYLKAMEASD